MAVTLFLVLDLLPLFSSSPFTFGRSCTSRNLSVSSFPKFWNIIFKRWISLEFVIRSPFSPPALLFCVQFSSVSLSGCVYFHSTAAWWAAVSSFDVIWLVRITISSTCKLHVFPYFSMCVGINVPHVPWPDEKVRGQLSGVVSHLPPRASWVLN